MVTGRLPSGCVLEVDLLLPGFTRSAGTREYRWPMLWKWRRTNCSGEKSQRRDATAGRYTSWWWHPKHVATLPCEILSAL